MILLREFIPFAKSFHSTDPISLIEYKVGMDIDIDVAKYITSYLLMCIDYKVWI
jgi:hypothetical protein